MLNENLILENEDVRDKIIGESNLLTSLEKIKVINFYPGKLFVGVKQAADFYEVSIEAIKSQIKRNRNELQKDGLKCLYKEELATLKKEKAITNNELYINPHTNKFIIIPKKALLRIGLLLSNSPIATLLRSYILNVSEKRTLTEKKDAINQVCEEYNIKNKVDESQENALSFLKFQLEENEINDKKEINTVRRIMHEADIYNFNLLDISLLLQENILKHNDLDKAFYEYIYKFKNNENKKIMLSIQNYIKRIAVTKFHGEFPEAYHAFCDNLKYRAGFDLQDIRFRMKKKYGGVVFFNYNPCAR